MSVVTSLRFPWASGVLKARMPFLNSRQYCLRLIATACAQAGCLASVVAFALHILLARTLLDVQRLLKPNTRIKDNLQIADKGSCTNLSVIGRFHCTPLYFNIKRERVKAYFGQFPQPG